MITDSVTITKTRASVGRRRQLFDEARHVGTALIDRDIFRFRQQSSKQSELGAIERRAVASVGWPPDETAKKRTDLADSDGQSLRHAIHGELVKADLRPQSGGESTLPTHLADPEQPDEDARARHPAGVAKTTA